ncbi:MAG: A/G-specific adenine glycosylase [Parcubacteria group bacterium]|nr:A/G-specific adenine glycosylase [Parcubacteria group bacterium]
MTILKFQKKILSWHTKNRRDMPWRKTKDPYKILVSEIMLQQTQVSRVIPKYLAFLRVFPTMAQLAKAPRLKLLKAWSGLGYWRRALSLQNTARIVQGTYAGKFPQDPKTLETLPGIGRYTARALACFAFGNTEAFLDTNIRRVYLHFFFRNKHDISDKEILKIAQKATDKTRIKEWHYALFDYGATALKDKAINKRSLHYAKQSKFEGSFRSFRTGIMRFLLDQPNQKATTNKIKRMLRKESSPYSSEKLLASLEKDDLIKKRGASYSL